MALLKYPGSKAQLASQITRHLPASADSYTEAYCGSAAILFGKSRHRMETINDRSGDLVNFMRVVRDEPQALARLISITPWCEDELRQAVEEPAEDPVRRALQFFVRSHMSRNLFDARPSFRRQYFVSRKKNGSGPMAPAARTWPKRAQEIEVYAQRLAGVAIESMDAREFLVRYDAPTAVHYIDPPYLGETRTNQNLYEHEMTDLEAHKALSITVRGLKGMVVLSHYPCKVYDNLYYNFHRVDLDARIDGGGSATESLYINPAAMAALQPARQARLI